jgi:hypothetical protein
MKELSPVIEAAAMRQTEDALRELMQTAENVGLSRPGLAMLLRTVADELQPPGIIHDAPTLTQ